MNKKKISEMTDTELEAAHVRAELALLSSGQAGALSVDRLLWWVGVFDKEIAKRIEKLRDQGMETVQVPKGSVNEYVHARGNPNKQPSNNKPM